MIGRRAAVALALTATLVVAAAAADRYPVTGLVLSVDPARNTFVASIDPIPGFMTAMTMPFRVPDAKVLAGVVAGAVVDFTLVVDRSASHAEDLHVRRYETVEQDPLAARRLSLMAQMASGRLVTPLAVGDLVPDFHLTDEHGRAVTLSQFRGKVIGVNFIYTTCQLPDYCLRLVNHFAVLQRRLAARLGRDLILLTITFDPVRDTPDVLLRYSAQWKPVSGVWRFLTGPPPDVQRVLDAFGVDAFPNDGLMDHSLHTALVDRRGRLAANVEGNQYSSDQLVDLTTAVLDAR